MTGPRELGVPSRFWKELAREHDTYLDSYGIESFKRHQAMRYFTWRWRWRSLYRSEQMRFLFAHVPPRPLFRRLFEPARISGSGWDEVPWSRAERWLYVFAVRLLWEYARRYDALDVLSRGEPELGRPLPVYMDGRLISQDLANTALEVAAIARALEDVRPRSILEVGAGYGRTAYAVLSVFPGARYTIVDIEPALTISRWYLSELFPQAHLNFLDPSELRRVPEGSVDLVVSISSLHEMTPPQLEGYLQEFDRVGRGGFVYLKQWRRWTNPADGVTLEFARYPIPDGWQLLFDEPAPVQTRFRQAAWRVPPQ